VEIGRRRSVQRLAALALAYPAPFLERRIQSMTTRARPRPARTAAFALVASLVALAAYRVEAPAAQPSVVQTPRAPAPIGARVTGRVTAKETGEPLDDVQIVISVPSTRLGTVSSESGAFRIANVPPGTYEIRAARVGLTSATRQITVVDGDSVELDFEMSTYTVGLPERPSAPVALRP
jgi:hypothetical protein